ncbi:hypothetical protein VTK56DRAFT_6559 [Thermocarpiscus australiensis]
MKFWNRTKPCPDGQPGQGDHQDAPPPYHSIGLSSTAVTSAQASLGPESNRDTQGRQSRVTQNAPRSSFLTMANFHWLGCFLSMWRTSPPSSAAPCTGPARNGTTYDNFDAGKGLLQLTFVPDQDVSLWQSDWVAHLRVKCADVPRLMREGFFWTVDNVLPEEGYMIPRLTSTFTKNGFRYGRIWSLADNSRSDVGESPRWAARLEVISRSISVVSGFRLQDLSSEQVCAAFAWNRAGAQIYQYDYDIPTCLTTASTTTNRCGAGGRGQGKKLMRMRMSGTTYVRRRRTATRKTVHEHITWRKCYRASLSMQLSARHALQQLEYYSITLIVYPYFTT